MLVYLGYGFNNPRPGPWQVTLQATNATPPSGTDYAISAQFKGGAILRAQASTLLPKTNEPVQFSARLELGGRALTIRDAQARIRYPDGAIKNIALTASGGDFRSSWLAKAPELYGVDIAVNGSAPDGTIVERGAFLSLEVQPSAEQFLPIQIASVAGIVAILGLFIVWIIFRIRGRMRRRKVH